MHSFCTEFRKTSIIYTSFVVIAQENVHYFALSCTLTLSAWISCQKNKPIVFFRLSRTQRYLCRVVFVNLSVFPCFEVVEHGLPCQRLRNVRVQCVWFLGYPVTHARFARTPHFGEELCCELMIWRFDCWKTLLYIISTVREADDRSLIRDVGVTRLAFGFETHFRYFPNAKTVPAPVHRLKKYRKESKIPAN